MTCIHVYSQTDPIYKNAPAEAFTSSNLPILVIQTTNNQSIVDDPKTTAHLGIIHNGAAQRNLLTDSYNHYDGSIGIELRGNSSQNLPKKPYNFETRDNIGANRNVPLLGMPAENDWTLIASYLDHTFARNLLGTHMSRQTGRWASRGRLVEVVINNQYQGIYILMEKIKRDTFRLDIANLTPDEITFPDYTGGFIYEITGFESNMGQSRLLKYPDNPSLVQFEYIKKYDDDFRNMMRSIKWKDETTGYTSWIDVESFIDEMMVQEALRNSDAYGWSAYFHKDKKGKLKAGPVWDFDQSSGNSSYPDNGNIHGWLFSHTATNNTPFFWKQLYSDPSFSYKLRRRWETLRSGPYKTETLLAYVDSIANLLSEAQEREFAKWPVLGMNIWRETYGYQERNTYKKEVDYLKNFLTQRWAWMDTELAKNIYSSAPSVSIYGNQSDQINAYPNPAKEYVIFDIPASEEGNLLIQLYDVTGRLAQTSAQHKLSPGNNSLQLYFDSRLINGIYFYKIWVNNQIRFVGRLIKAE
jgi:hypothetical protein